MLKWRFCEILSLYEHTKFFVYHKYHVIAKSLLSAMIFLYHDID